MAADDRNDEPRALRERVRELEQRFDTLSTKIEDSNGRQWSVSKLVSEFGLTRRQAIGVLGLLAVGVSLPGALTQIAMAGTDEAGLIGSASSPQDVWVEDIYDKNDNAVMELPGDGSVSIMQVGNSRHFAEDYPGSDADSRLSNALSAANDGDVIYLEAGAAYGDRTISTSVRLIGTYLVPPANDTTIGDWTLDSRIALEHVTIQDNDSGNAATLTANAIYCQIQNVQVNSNRLISVASDRALLSHISGAGDVTFQSGTADGEIGITDGRISVTDNGSNSIL